MLAKKYPLLGSSVNPDNVAMRFKAVALAVVPMVIMIASAFSLELKESEILNVIEVVTGIISGALFLYGWIRSLKIKQK